MGFFDFFRRPDINAGVEKFRSIAYRGLYCWTCGMMQNSGEVIFREA